MDWYLASYNALNCLCVPLQLGLLQRACEEEGLTLATAL